MPGKTSAVVMNELELRRTALEANKAELAHLEMPRQKVEAMLSEIRDLTAKQASLTAAKQESSKRLAELIIEGQKLLTFVDVAVRQHYGNRSEKLVEFGQQPFRSQPRIKLVEVAAKPPAAPSEPPAAPKNESSLS